MLTLSLARRVPGRTPVAGQIATAGAVHTMLAAPGFVSVVSALRPWFCPSLRIETLWSTRYAEAPMPVPPSSLAGDRSDRFVESDMRAIRRFPPPRIYAKISHRPLNPIRVRFGRLGDEH